MLVYASLSAYFVKTDGFYSTLTLPEFALSPLWITVGWSVIYLVDIAVISRLIYYKESTYIVIPVMILGFCNVLYCMVFFVFGMAGYAFLILLFMAVFVVVIAIFLIKEESFTLIFWQIKIVWYIYLCVVGYYIMALNK